MIPTRLKEHLTAYRRIVAEPVRYYKRNIEWDRNGLYEGPTGFRQSGYFIGQYSYLGWEEQRLFLWQLYARERIAGLTAPKNRKPFYFNVLPKWSLDVHAAVRHAVSNRMVGILAPYYGLLPELSHMGLFVSGLGEPWTDSSTPLGTQCLHRDNWDRKHVKVFVHLTDVTEDDGPLCLLPADMSTWLMKKTGHYWNCKPYRDDSEWRKHINDKCFIKVTGPAGTVAIVDTSACLHYGSRTRAGRQRQVFVIHYTEFSAYSDAVTGEYEDINLPTCPELAVGLTGRQRLVFRTL